MWPATLHIGHYSARQTIGKAWFNQSAGHLYDCTDCILQNVLEANKHSTLKGARRQWLRINGKAPFLEFGECLVTLH